MGHQTIFIMVRVVVQSDHVNISDTVNDIETASLVEITDTPKVKVTETEILLTRVRNLDQINRKP